MPATSAAVSNGLAIAARSIQTGLLVRAGLDSGSDSNGSTRTISTATTTTSQPRGKTYYRIRAGDTLGGVATRFDTTVAALLALNPDVRPNSLTIGQRLRVR